VNFFTGRFLASSIILRAKKRMDPVRPRRPHDAARQTVVLGFPSLIIGGMGGYCLRMIGTR